MYKLLKTKGTIGECQGTVVGLAPRRDHWGSTCRRGPAAVERKAKARPYDGLLEEEKRQQGWRTLKARSYDGMPPEICPEVAR